MLKQKILEMIEQTLAEEVEHFMPGKSDPDEWDYDGLIKAVNEMLPILGLVCLNIGAADKWR